MLVLSRKKDESIIIGDNIEIKVVDIKEKVVKLGIKAPKHVPVYRSEIYYEIKKENLEALNSFGNIDDIKIE